MNAIPSSAARLVAMVLSVCVLLLPAPTMAGDGDVLRLLDSMLEFERASDPIAASQSGDRRFDRLWPEVSEAAIAASASQLTALLDEVRATSVADTLSPERRVDLELMTFVLESRLRDIRHHAEQIPLTHQLGPVVSYPQFPAQLVFSSRDHYADYLARLQALPAHLKDIEANMRAGAAAGRTPPRIVLRDVPAQARAVAADRYRDHPESHPMFAPFRSADAPADLRDTARDTVLNTLLPAWTSFADFLERDYLPAARESLAATDLPDGEAFYADQIRYHTTLDLTAEAIHRLGLDEVARLRADMFAVIDETGFSADHPNLGRDELFRAFTTDLRTNPRFYHESAEDLLRHYRDICKRMDAELPRLFGRLPRLTYGVKALPDFIAPSAPTAYYYPGSPKTGVPGYFMANTHALDQRPKYEAVALALHEAVPGHHFQFALAQELEEKGLHEWRTGLYLTAFSEGWGLYSELLGLEVGSDHPRGMYADPYDEFGRLSYEMWRAMRLVVDTGIHAMGWSRADAIDYMRDNSAITEANIVSEVDRYIAWPAQALGYKVGELFIRDLRARAERELGPDFDLRAFHDCILATGGVTLPMLERVIDDWIQRQRAD